jgi:hypothetical protein
VRIRVQNIFLLLTIVGNCLKAQPVDAPSSQAVDVVRQLYHQVIVHHPLGVPYGTAKTAIWPLLSRRLVKVFETRNACDRDWSRQNPDADKPPNILKAPGFFEDGLFTGPDEEGFIIGAAIERAVKREDGSFLVHVRVAHRDYGFAPSHIHTVSHWRVEVMLVPEDKRFRVDDILFPQGYGGGGTPVWMSKMITSGCNGVHWVGNSTSLGKL